MIRRESLGISFWIRIFLGHDFEGRSSFKMLISEGVSRQLNREGTKYAKFRKESSRNFAYFVS